MRGPCRRVAGRSGEPCSLVDPGSQYGHLLPIQSWPLGGHPDVGIESGDIAEKGTGSSVAGSNGFLSEIASGNGDLGAVEPVVTFLPLGSVTGEAVFCEDRPDVTIEVDLALDRRRQVRWSCVTGGHGESEDCRGDGPETCHAGTVLKGVREQLDSIGRWEWAATSVGREGEVLSL